MKKNTLEMPKVNDIIFTTGRWNDNKEVMRISKGKFFWKGVEVKDAKNVYERFHQWLCMVEKPKKIIKKS
jgi:hypothetical protein